MSQPTADEALTGASHHIGDGIPVSPAAALGAVALVPTAGLTTLRLLRNAPVGLPSAARAATPVVATLAAVVPALALLGLALATERRAGRVALAAVGVFAVLGAVDTAAWLPAAAATVVGGAVALALELGLTDDVSSHTLRRIQGPALVAALGVAALTCSLAGSAGIGPAALRPAGATLAFVTLASLPLARGLDGTVDLGLWVAVTVGVVAGAVAAPFVAGAIVLVALGAGAVPFALVAIGVGGAVATAVADARRHAFGPAVAAALLLLAGVPGTLSRAVAFVLALVVLAREWDVADAAVASGGVTDA